MDHWTNTPNPEFERWWATMKAAGYQYGREALENVRFGFEGAQTWIDPMIEKPPIQRFVSGQGWQPSKPPYVLAVDVKGRMSVGYAREHSTAGYLWVFAKPIGEPTRWMRLPRPPSL